MAATLAAFGLRGWIGGPHPGYPGMILFVAPIALGAYVGGLGPGLSATALSITLVSWSLVTGNPSSGAIPSIVHLQLFSLVASGIVLSVLSEALHRSRRRHEAAEVDAEERQALQALLEKTAAKSPSLLSVFRMRPDGTCTMPYVTPGYAKFFGVPAETLAKTADPVFALIHPDDVGQLQRGNIESARTLSPWHHQFRARRDDGRKVWMEGHYLPEREADGSVVWYGFLADITERKRIEEARRAVEEALRSSEARFRDLAENIHEVFWLTALDKNRLEYISPAYEAIWGRSCASLYETPQDWIAAIHPDDRERVKHAAMTKQLDGTYDEEYRIVRPDGTIRWIRDQAFPVRDKTGQVVRVAGVAQDITERRQLQLQLQQSGKMESIGLLAGGVAHDFNNWLTVIAANAEVLKATTGEDQSAAECCEEIAQAVQRASSLTRQLLAFSRRDVVEPKVLDMNAVVAETEKMLRRLLGEDIVVSTRLDDQVGRVKIDPNSIVQLLMNLAVNARDAMPRGGRLSIETATTVLDEAYTRLHPRVRPGTYSMLAVTDTGTGIPPELRARVFEPFFTTKGVGRGTGLGLAVVHGIVEQAGGHVEVYSEVGVGTTFKIYLPVVEAPSSVVRDLQLAPKLTGHETILLVEDEPSLRRVGTRVLQANGYRVLQACDGEEALRILQSADGPIDMVFTDVVMPRMAGRELSDAVRKLQPAMKVLFTSGYTDDAVMRHGLVGAEVPFLRKPYATETMLKKVRETLDRA